MDYPKNYTVGYAYASSIWANKFHFKDGCYVVECRQGPKFILKAISAHATKEEALEALKVGAR